MALSSAPATCAGGGGQLTREDLGHYQVARREPLSVGHREARLTTNPPPSRGGILIAFALQLLEHAPVADPAGWMAWLAQAMRLTNEAREIGRAHG